MPTQASGFRQKGTLAQTTLGDVGHVQQLVGREMDAPVRVVAAICQRTVAFALIYAGGRESSQLAERSTK